MNALSSPFVDRDRLVRESYSNGTTSGHSLGKGSKAEVDAYIKLRNLLLVRERGNNKSLPVDLSGIKCNITFGTQQFSYWDPNNPAISGNICLLGAGLEDPAIQNAVQEYFAAAGAAPWQQDYSIEANSKGAKNGRPPLVKDATDTTLQNLTAPWTWGQIFDTFLPEFLSKLPPGVGPAEKQIIARRFISAEHDHTKKKEELTAKIAAREQAKTVPGNNVQLLESEITQLKALLEELNNLDLYALFKVLSLYPAGPMHAGDKEAFANYVFEQVTKEILEKVESDWQQQAGTLAKFREKFPGASKRKLTEAQIAYARDIAGMVYLDREGYFNHCRQNNLKTKREGIADVFLREALKFSMHRDRTPGEEFKAEDFQKCIFLNKMGDALKAEMRADFRNHGIVATHAIGPSVATEYQTQAMESHPDPANATPEEMKAIEDRNAGRRTANFDALKRDIATHRERVRVNKGLTIDDVRARWNQNNPDPGVMSTPVPMPLQTIASGARDLMIAHTPTVVTRALNGVVPTEISQLFQNIPNMLPNQVTAVAAMSAGVHFLREITPPAVFAEFSKVAPAFLVQAVETAQQNPQAFLAVATALGMLATWVYPSVYGADGTRSRKLNHTRIALAGAMTVGGVALALNAPNAMAQWFTAAVDYLSVPSNLVNLVGWTVVGNVGLSSLRERKIKPLLGAAALGSMLAYGEPLGMIGAAGTATVQAVSSAVQYVIYSNPVTGTVGNGVAGVVRAIASVAAPLAVAEGVKLYGRLLLPEPVGEVVANGATKYSEAVLQVQGGKRLGAAASTVYGVSTAAMHKIFTTVYPLFMLLGYYFALLRKSR